ncbi:hypothetical protein Hanom_Chr03g00234321 [Helianthus anomalus]
MIQVSDFTTVTRGVQKNPNPKPNYPKFRIRFIRNFGYPKFRISEHSDSGSDIVFQNFWIFRISDIRNITYYYF